MLFGTADSRLANASLAKESHMIKGDLRGRKVDSTSGGRSCGLCIICVGGRFMDFFFFTLAYNKFFTLLFQIDKNIFDIEIVEMRNSLQFFYSFICEP